MSGDNNKNIIVRIGIFYGLLLLVGGYFFIRIFYLQLVATDEDGNAYSEMASQTRVGKKNFYPRRGSILAHNGVPLAVSVPSYYIYMDYLAGGLKDDTLKKYIKPLSVSLASYFKEKNAAEYESEIKNNRAIALKKRLELQKRFRVPSYNKKITRKELDIFQLEKVKEFPLYKNRAPSRSGLVVEESGTREYLYGGMAYRTIGYMGKGGNSVGIESAYDKYLVGKGIEKRYQITAKGDTIWQESDNEIPEDGCDVISTLDVDIQDIAETALLKSIARSNNLFSHGTAIVMETATGNIRAMVNLNKQSDGRFLETMNHAISEATDPGSTFKIVSLMAALEAGRVDITDEIDCGEKNFWIEPKSKKKITEAGNVGLGKVSVQTIIEKSSNIGTVKMMMAFDGREDEYMKLLDKMYVGKKVNFDLAGEAKPVIRERKNWSKTTLPQMAIGYEMQLAPIHTLTFYNAIANDGKMVKPRIVEGIKKGDKVDEFRIETLCSSICSKSTLSKVRAVLNGVVTSGTGRPIKGTPYGIAGKTGTAQIAFKGRSGRMVYRENGLKRHQASFCGYFPDKDPKYSCIVVLYTDKILESTNFYGATWAAPVFKEIADKIYAISPEWQNSYQEEDTKFLPPFKTADATDLNKIIDNWDLNIKIPKTGWIQLNTQNDSLKITEVHISKTVPNVVGMSLSDAVWLMESAGIATSFEGKGRVKKQSMEAGAPVGKGAKVNLQLSIL